MIVFDNNGKLDADVQDTLYELGNVGLGMASVTIGRILGVRVFLESPTILPLSGGQIEEFVTGEVRDKAGENMGFFMDFKESLQGMMLLIIGRDFISKIVEKMTGCTYNGEELLTDEMSFSAISEFANMITAAYAKAIGSYTGIRVYLSPVMADINGEKALLEKALERLSSECRTAISVKTDFVLTDQEGERTDDTGRVIILPGEDSVKKLMEALGM